MKSRLKSPMAAVVAGAVVLVLAGGTSGAMANKLINGKDIAKNAVGAKHVKKDAIRSGHIQDGTIKPRDLHENLRERLAAAGAQGPAGPAGPAGAAGADGQDGAPGSDAILGLEYDRLTTAVPVTIGGSIFGAGTDLDTGVTLDAGTYLVTVGGAFRYNADATPASVGVYPQLSLWIDADGNESFNSGEGSISPNALIPNVVNRHIQVGDTTVIEVAADGTYVGLIGHGYAENGSSAGSGDIEVFDATITATPIG